MPSHDRRFPRLLTLTAALLAAAVSWSALAPPPAPARAADAPAAATDTPKAATNSEPEKVKKLLDYLEADYAKKGTSPFWVSRAMGAISLARSPRASATTKLFEMLEKDKHEVVRLLAWQALLARAHDLDSKWWLRFSTQTQQMAAKDMFHGQLRAPLLKSMACMSPNATLKKVWEKLFTECSSWEPDDVVVLDALGECLAAWRSPAPVDGLIGMMATADVACRAEHVLRRAGCPVRSTISTLKPEIFDPQAPNRAHPSWDDMWATTRKECETWWKAEKPKWKEIVKPEGPVWKDLKGKFVAGPLTLDEIDPTDKMWYKDLELGNADIQQFEAAFLVDATGTMGDVLEWIKRDLGRTAAAFQMLAKEPTAVGIDFYRDYDDPWTTKFLPLTAKLQTIEPDVVKMEADGGGDVPEAILPALKETLEKNKWSKRTTPGSKIIILIGDAPPHSKEMEALRGLAKTALERGIKIHAAKVKTELGRNDLSDFDEIAKLGGGATVDVEFRRPVAVRYVTMTGRDIPYKTMARPEAQLVVAGAADLDPPGEKILTLIISDAINPQYRDRVEPLARTLLAFTARPSKPEKRLPFPANTPPLQKGTLNAQGK